MDDNEVYNNIISMMLTTKTETMVGAKAGQLLK